MYNILTEPLIRFNSKLGASQASLPDVYAALMRDEVEAFPALRPHQRHAWHAFLVQLGAMAMHRAGMTEPPTDAEDWRRIIRALTPKYPDDEPWKLVVDDITTPAFMQPPAKSEERSDDYKNRASDGTPYLTPSALDMLDTAKNHDIKMQDKVSVFFDDWIFALVNQQTMDGQRGRGNYPISRMNSGDGSRTAFSITPSANWGIHVKRDIKVLLELSGEITKNFPMQWDRLGLVWTKQWDGKKVEALTLEELHPFYIEICRLWRLRTNSTGQIYAEKAGSEWRRIFADKMRGNVGDPWTLVDKRDKKGDKVLTLQYGGFTYRRIVDYMNPANWDRPILSRSISSEQQLGEMQLIARGIRRKKGGQTEGYYERVIPFKQKTIRAFGLSNSNAAAELAEISLERIADIAKVQRILSHAIQVFLAKGDANNISPEHRKLASPWLNQLDSIIDARFFDDLQDEFELDDLDERKRKRNQWLMNGSDGVIDEARELLHQAEDSLPCPAIQRYRARVRADSVFEGRIRGNNGFSELYS